ncbi:receptor-like protein kinase FERONIA [Pyrus ussuriensis x Pyrus communis]|uniref:Receptor-like protein kinase FERONIA n=1 Tax=Pyrus ussuriensis x Pyrus communis TaxID=2448454 RepID=A0A5N5I5N5_9ROSA|nr:receptor-like protein kinase FERONIA [Pyrus ussuriensis x Pyrus communis]
MMMWAFSIGKIWSKVAGEIWGREVDQKRRNHGGKSKDGREMANLSAVLGFLKKSRDFYCTTGTKVTFYCIIHTKS